MNKLQITGTLQKLEAVRYTPAGIAALDFLLTHQSEQFEAGVKRQVQCDLTCICLGDIALILKEASIGVPIELDGFLANRSSKSNYPIFHATSIQFC